MLNTGGLLYTGGLLFRSIPLAMRYEKPATDIDTQLGLLRRRNLTISSEDLARRWLLTVGYYRLSAYWLFFEVTAAEGETRSKHFADGTCFEDVIDLYVFDRKLRLIVTEAIERIEIAVRSRWTNRLSLACGSHAHLNPELFVSGWDHANRVAQLAKRTKDSNEVFVKHYRSKYDRPYMPPLWMVTELMTFGELSKWVEATDDAKVRGAVAKDVGLPTQETLIGTLQVLSYVRNICAHHGRLWNRRTVKRLPSIKRFKKSLVMEPATGSEQLQLSNRIYNILSVLSLLIRHQAPDTTYTDRLRTLVETRNADQLNAMGFPDDWPVRPAWRPLHSP